MGNQQPVFCILLGEGPFTLLNLKTLGLGGGEVQAEPSQWTFPLQAQQGVR